MCTYRKTLAITPSSRDQLNYGDQTTRTAPRRLSKHQCVTLFGAGITGMSLVRQNNPRS